MQSLNAFRPSRKYQVLDALVKWLFFASLVLLPWRWRIVLLARPNGTLYGDYTDFLLFLPDVTMTIALLVWGFVQWRKGIPLRMGPAFIWAPLAGLTLTGWISIFNSVDKALSSYHALRLGVLFLFYLYVVNAKISIFDISFAVAAQGTLQASIALSQSILQRSIGLQVLGEHLLDPQWAGISIVTDGMHRFLRAYGLSDHPNILGGCLAFGLVVLFARVLNSERKFLLKVGFPFVLMAAALFLTFSRSAWLAFLTGAGFSTGMQMWKQRRKNLQPAAWLALATVIFLLPFFAITREYLNVRLNVRDSFATIPAEKQSAAGRTFLNASANRIFVKHPLTGIGLGASPVAMKNEYAEFPIDYQPPHFTLLAAAMETGFFGATFYFLLMILPWLALLRRRDLWTNPQLIGAAGMLLAVTVVGFFDYYTWLTTPGRIWQWLAWGMFAAAMQASH
jgi:O-antigen ligase